MKKVWKKVLIITGICLAGILLIVGSFGLAGNSYVSRQSADDTPAHVDVTPNEFGTVVAVGRGLYDTNGDRFDIKGINFGNLFVAEGWMTVNSVGALYNKDGSFQSVNGKGVVEAYEEIYQEEMDAIFAERFTDDQIEALNDAFFASYCTEADFKLLSDLGMNTVRIHMYYRNFLTTYDRYHVSDEELCARDFESIDLDFSKLDQFIEYADKYGIKVIVDMHGVMGGQSGFEHCGTRDIDFWDNEEYIEFEELKGYLNELEVNYTINKLLVRGLDYYNRTVFEIKSNNLGSQNAVCGGGRYDSLVKNLGGEDTPAVGFAMGMERLASLIGNKNEDKTQAFVVCNNPIESIKLTTELRRKGISCEFDLTNKKFVKQLEKASKVAKYAIILGEDEIASNQLTVKNLETSEQQTVLRTDIEQILK